ncbi:adhesion G protein-coupled receptor E3, partial [Biomphalaria glabrata]
GDCLQLRCSPGKTLTNGTCSSIFTDITGLVYRVRALLFLHNMSSTKENMTTMKMMDMAIKQ